jgi:hypothetical protein
MRKTHVVLHHSATKDTGSVSWGAIRKWHIVENGYLDIGYHLGIEEIDGVYEVLLGRPFDADGAHAPQRSMNRVGLGVMFCGDFNKTIPRTEMLQYAAARLRPIMSALGIPADREHVLAHGDVAPYKSLGSEFPCPGRNFNMVEFIGLLR